MSAITIDRSVEQAPKVLIEWAAIMEDLSYPSPVRVGKVLGVDPVFVDGWNRDGNAPRWAKLALWWLTRWGRAEVHEMAVRDASLAMQCLRAVERERDDLLRLSGVSPVRQDLVQASQFASIDVPAVKPSTWCDDAAMRAAVDRMCIGKGDWRRPASKRGHKGR